MTGPTFQTPHQRPLWPWILGFLVLIAVAWLLLSTVVWHRSPKPANATKPYVTSP